ncbi:hypothetical protein PPTG_07137 [Phytophthora nicotianae INRA-310]|uniref:Uncharacterized protein n=1 Tax=Phytophthora nicotianae (strain INRA-310) TaxID=761204 RepID=W2QQW5_PHYN3|nr:hypothetical protein PPTG_07137 [Phytophthora nicotianae INRA-310]ETN14889.1 hypothetical protein PPTG_07137 [Phytophthora nicotianae INRA-310]
MASLRPSASSRALLVEIQSTAGLRATKKRPQSDHRLQRSPLQRRHRCHRHYRHLHRRRRLLVLLRLRLLLFCRLVLTVSVEHRAIITSGRRFGGVGRVWRVDYKPPEGTALWSAFRQLKRKVRGGRLGGSARGTSAIPPPSASGLFDGDSDEETEPVGGLNRLRRSTDSGDWHPYALPPVPAKHPANGRTDHYDPSAPSDYSVPVNVEQLHNARGEYPHRCFLVEWQVTPLQLDLSPGVFANYYKKYFACRDQASPAASWTRFERRFISLVTLVLHPRLLNYEWTLSVNIQALSTEFFSSFDASYTNVERFQTFVQTLREGVYLTSIGDGLVGHCVVIRARGPDTAVSVLDGVEPPVTPEPLTNLERLDKVKWMGLMKLNPGYRCRRGKCNAKSNESSQREKAAEVVGGVMREYM